MIQQLCCGADISADVIFANQEGSYASIGIIEVLNPLDTSGERLPHSHCLESISCLDCGSQQMSVTLEKENQICSQFRDICSIFVSRCSTKTPPLHKIGWRVAT